MRKINIDLLAEAEILDESAKKIKIGDLWKSQKVLFVFLRHFACIACRAHAVKVWADREKYFDRGLKIIFISNGSPHFIRSFREDLKLEDAPIYTDPSLEAFQICSFKRGALSVLGPKSMLSAVKLLAEGHRQGSMRGDVGDYWQLGGVLEMHPGNKMAFHYVSQCTGDYPKG